jgi:hypothetical protein
LGITRWIELLSLKCIVKHCQLKNLRLFMASFEIRLMAFLNIQSLDCIGPRMIDLISLIEKSFFELSLNEVTSKPSSFIYLLSLNLISFSLFLEILRRKVHLTILKSLKLGIYKLSLNLKHSIGSSCIEFSMLLISF